MCESWTMGFIIVLHRAINSINGNIKREAPAHTEMICSLKYQTIRLLWISFLQQVARELVEHSLRAGIFSPVTYQATACPHCLFGGVNGFTGGEFEASAPS